MTKKYEKIKIRKSTRETMMVSVFDVANYFLSLVDHESEDCISNLKLQKLCYYAQGLYLAATGERLFNNSIQAWQHGPVIPELYRKYKGEGASCLLVDSDFDFNKIPKDIRDFLDDVYCKYGQFSAWRLRDMTHQEMPWISSYNKSENDLISDQKLKDFFKTRIEFEN